MTNKIIRQHLFPFALSVAALILVLPVAAQDDGWRAETRFGAKAKRVGTLIKEADDARAAGNYKDALKKYRSIEKGSINLRNRGRSVVMQGQCLWEMDEPLSAYQMYKKALDNYAGFIDFDEVLEREFEVGEYYYEKKSNKFMLIRMSTSAMATDVFDHIVRVAPYSEFAPKALLYSGKIAVRDSDFHTASSKFRRILTQFRNSEQAADARLALAESLLDEAREGDGDGSKIREANRNLERFLVSHPQHERREHAVKLQAEAREVEANRLLALGEFYLRDAHLRPEASARYLRELLAKYPDSASAPVAETILGQMNDRLEATPTPDEPPILPKLRKKPKAVPSPTVKQPAAEPGVKPERPSKPASTGNGKFLLPIEDLGGDK
jgi:outer membrane protein assembly factor BamD (BamD/ComL family)